MAPVNIKHVVSFTSQDPKNSVENLCNAERDFKPWLCSPRDHSGVLRAELQLERVSRFGYIDVGNCGSAFIQIDVGRSSWLLDQPYITLLPMTTLMSPAESRQGTGRTGVRMFKKADFLLGNVDDSWDRVRVTCTQPFNKRSQFGLSFLRVCSPEDEKGEDSKHTSRDNQGLTTPEKSSSGVREWLSSPAVQRTFFGRTHRKGVGMSRTSRMVLTASQVPRRPLPSTSLSDCSASSTSTQNTILPTAKPDTATPNKAKPDTATPNKVKSLGNTGDLHPHTASMACLSTARGAKETTPLRQPKRKQNSSRSQQNHETHNTPIKQGKSAVNKRPTSRPEHTSTTPPDSPAEDPEITCPICGEFFTMDLLPFHASSCQGGVTRILPGGVVTPVPPSSLEESMLPCPLCSFSLKNNQGVWIYAGNLHTKEHFSRETMENLTPEQWQEIVNKKMRFPPELINAIQEGNMLLVCGLLKTGDGIIRQLEDSEDRLWREALNLSIRLGNEDTMDALLNGIKFDFRQIHEALLVAVDTNQPRVVKRLLDRLDLEKGNKMDVRSFSLAIFDHSIDDSQFAPGVTPLTLACQKDLYEIVTMLTQKGHVIPWPHKISCACLECRNGRQYDLLKFSLSRINTYRGIASRAYLSITSEDAMLSAFSLSKELRKLSKKEPEFKPQYLGLEELCQEFAVELLGMCRNQSEVTTILNSCGDESQDALDQQAFEEGIPNLTRLRLAVNFNQKQFVAHPICQQVLSSIWCGNLSGWRGSRTVWKLLVSVGIFFTMPLFCLIYWIAPKSKVGKILKIPVIKFLVHSATYLWFLITLLGESITMELYRDQFASRQQNVLHSSIHMVWVVGFFWYECKEVWIEGLHSYLLDWWNCLDMMVLSMYLASFTLRIVIMLKGHFLCQAPDDTEECMYFTQTGRQNWHQGDPQFIAELLFAVTSMLSFTRLAYILPAQESLGTLQISIGKMIDDMMRFMFILMIIGTAFLCGINNIYVPYVDQPYLGRFNETFRFLFWTMFGVNNQDYVDMPQFVAAEMVGRILYGIFTLVIVIVLLNMLIAMITNSFQKIEDDADVEWKFARSKLYLSYFREGLTMPVPFNTIPSPKAFFYLIRGVFRWLCCCCTSPSTPDYPPIASMEMDNGGSGAKQIPYRQQVIRALVQRYIESARREFEETKRKDVGNRITELNKVVGRLHAEMKAIMQVLVDSGQAVEDPNTDGASILGKYIMGAKNNFKGFYSPGDKHPPLQVTVHRGGAEGVLWGGKRRTELEETGGAGTAEEGEMESEPKTKEEGMETETGEKEEGVETETGKNKGEVETETGKNKGEAAMGDEEMEKDEAALKAENVMEQLEKGEMGKKGGGVDKKELEVRPDTEGWMTAAKHHAVIKMEEGRADGVKRERRAERAVKESELGTEWRGDTDLKEIIKVNGIESVRGGTNQIKADGRTEGKGISKRVDGMQTNRVTGVGDQNRSEDLEGPVTTRTIGLRDVNSRKMEGRVIELKENKGLWKINVAQRCTPGTGGAMTEKVDVKMPGEQVFPSPTGSSNSQDTGFSSQEEEGSIDGGPMSPGLQSAIFPHASQ
ncbi:hypothetical protein DPEC_G00232630 [Dallia pectoralis]|uniref:Uncharacterized protein n=1 Tax=Dallia pectoralis TaxID=75939 RepID=A0ACC2FX76_DALPE|nr:hypothetical protein DPEC_G00232630 [Dallia pectoralis]